MVKTKYIAEIGLNHNGSLDLAKKHIESAKSSGADYAKFQTYFTEKRAKPGSKIRDILSSCELSIDQFAELKEFCDSLDIGFASTAFCKDSAQLLEDIGCSFIKIASFQIGNKELIEDLSISNWIKELWISTGMSNPSEIYSAHKILTDNNSLLSDKFCFMHCVSQYPIKQRSDYSLINIPWLREVTGKSAGYSDHTLGSEAAVVAVALGARLIEKHFTIDNKMDGADHAMSANPEVFSDLVIKCQEVETMIGSKTRSESYTCEQDCLQFKD